jgi:hypothetical protein
MTESIELLLVVVKVSFVVGDLVSSWAERILCGAMKCSRSQRLTRLCEPNNGLACRVMNCGGSCGSRVISGSRSEAPIAANKSTRPLTRARAGQRSWSLCLVLREAAS